ncbi:MAG: thioredoxin family protein [Planctomycetota bacterium]
MKSLARLPRIPLTALVAALIVTSASAATDGWTEDFPEAKAQVKASGQDLLMYFTGSDWCPPCIALNDEVLSTEAFLDAAPRDFVLVKLDFPNTIPQTETLVNQNQALAAKYDVGTFPTILLADASGTPYAKTGYRPGGAEPYLAHLDELRANRVARDEAMAIAKEADGLDKARAFDDAMDAVGLDLAVAHYPSVVAYIMALDPDNAAGLKGKYDAAMLEVKIDADVQEAIEILQAGEIEAGLARLDQVIEDHSLEGEFLQMVIAIKGQVHLQLGEKDQAISLLEQAVAVDPKSEIAGQINAMIEHVKSMPANTQIAPSQ